jgi:hypothetical protein
MHSALKEQNSADMAKRKQQAEALSSYSSNPKIIRTKKRSNSANSNASKFALTGDLQYHFFLSHFQGTGGDQVYQLSLEMQAMGFKTWWVVIPRIYTLAHPMKPRYDQTASDLTADGMKEGIERSNAFVLFLSKGVESRPCVLISSS